ncbi:MAG TPA: efflux RND transporter periplasmic adaptor subunit [Puia sp.]|nr:efflux RND transporter periplasmic adaptor subunit [Puia sp.]
MKKRRIIIVVAILLAAALVWIFFFRKKEPPVVLQTENPQVGYISQSVTATGNIQPVDTVTVGSQVSGIISALYTDFNAKVTKGKLLAQLDKSLFVASVNQNKASVASAQSQLIYQQSNFQRQELLYKTGAISKADYDNATYSINAAKAAVDNAKAQLAASEKNLSYTDIYSPMDGVVLTRNISVGQTVAASFNTPTFFTIAKDITKMQVQANVDEADIGNVVHGQRVTFTVDAFLDDVFQGSVDEVRLKPVTSANVVTYTTIINAPNDDQKLKPGMTANVTIYTKEVNNALLISAKALKFEPDPSLTKKYTIIADSSDGGRRKGNREKLDQGQGADTGMTAREDSGAGRARHHKTGSAKDSTTGSSLLKRGDTTPTKVKDSSRVQASEIAHVWVLVDSTRLVQKKIRTGINNDTQVEVLRGLTPADVVVTGIEQVTTAKGGPAAKSPFMPARPNRRGTGGGGRGVR